MNYIKRIIDISKLLTERSLFLFGPRQTGKSSYITNQLALEVAKIYNLLDQALYQKLVRNPALVRQEIEALKLRDCLIVIDEIQKCPELLDEIHLMIEQYNIRFLLTGSSARKLKRAGVNLLGGRARSRSFHPFVFPEFGMKAYNLEKAINHGLIPYHYLSDDPEEDLQSFVGQYLTEEIAAEGITRNIPQFARFLEVAGTANAQLINYSAIGSDAGVSRQTVQGYFSILKDTLLGYELPPFTKTVKRKAITTNKFYFFDTGIVRILKELTHIPIGSKDFGDAFEHLIFLELRAFIDYCHPTMKLQYWRSKSGAEVDFILNKSIAIEVKASTRLNTKDLKGLRYLKEEGIMKQFIIVCREDTRRLQDDIQVYPWAQFLEDLWQGLIVTQ